MTSDSKDVSIEVKSVPLIPGQWELLFTVVTASFTNVSLVFFLTSILTMVSAWEWTNNLVWPLELFLASFVGGIFGGTLAFFEVKNFLEQKRKLKPGTLIASDLLYLTGVLGLIYFLEFLSESSLMHAVLWFTVVFWFTVFAQNIIKIIWQGYGFRSDVSPE